MKTGEYYINIGTKGYYIATHYRVWMWLYR